MKTSKIAAGGLGIALVAALSLGGAATTASAADYFVTTLPPETAPYSEGWFSGTATPQGTATFTPYGLDVTGKFQLLNGTPPTQDVTVLADNTEGFSDDNEWFFQIPIFGNPGGLANTAGPTGQQYTTLRPDVAGSIASSGNWTTSGAIYDNGGNILINAETSTTFAAIVTALGLPGPANYEILAYGYFWVTGATDTMYFSSYLADTYWFLPEPTLTVTPSPVGLDAFKTAGKGITISGTGAYPFSDVYFDLYAPTGPGVNVGPVEADANGNFSVVYVAPANAVVGTYTVDAFNTELWEQSLTFSVVPTLAATGSEVSPALFIGATSLLLAGAVLMIVRRRKATA